MKNKLLIVIQLFVCLAIFQLVGATPPKTITIDVSKNDKLNISQIAEVKAIPLNFIQKEDSYVGQVIVSPDYLYVSVAYKEEIGKMEIYQLKKDGSLIRQVGLKREDSKEFLKAKRMGYLENTGELAIVYDKHIAIFDGNGKFIRKFEHSPYGDLNIFNNKIWSMLFRLEPENERIVYNLVSEDLTTLHIDTLFKYIHQTSRRFGAFAVNSISVADNKLYFTNEYERALMSVNGQNKVEKSYQFAFKNLGRNSVDIDGSTFCQMFNKYICYGYMIQPKKDFYCFLYNRTTGKSYNFQIKGKNDEIVAGIKDDIFDTGYFKLSQTNSGDYAYFRRFSSKVSGKVQGPKDKSVPVIFLVKFK